MVEIYDKIIRKQKNFWSNCVFHPTDAVEDPWGKRILDQISADGAIKTIRIYTMFEDMMANFKLSSDARMLDIKRNVEGKRNNRRK